MGKYRVLLRKLLKKFLINLDLKNTNEQTRANSGNEIRAYEEVVIDSGIHNDGVYDESFPSSGHNKNTGGWSGIFLGRF
jgi:hypothetical protein